MKTCIKCNLSYSISKFNNGRGTCRTCLNKAQVIADRGYVRRASKLFQNLKYRLRKDPSYIGRVCTFTKEEFLSFVVRDEQYHGVYVAWVCSGHQYQFTPTVDRIDNSRDYHLDNIQILPMFVNCKKDKRKYTVEEKRLKEREWSKSKINKRKEHYLQLARARYHRHKHEVQARRRELARIKAMNNGVSS